MPKREAELLLEDIREKWPAWNATRVEWNSLSVRRQDDRRRRAKSRNHWEAARLLPVEFKLKHADIAWAQIAGLRNRIVHDYFGLDLEIIWQVLQTSLPDLNERPSNL